MTTITVRLLGSVEIRDAGGREATKLSHQPKLLALLSYLATAQPRGFHRRDKLLALFWAEASQAQARHSLSQALHVLRSELGEGAVTGRGDSDVAIDETVISCDVVEFERAVDAGEYEEALELYRGDLLEGLFIREASEFERWLDDERSRLREKAAGAAWALAQEHLAADRLVDAERTAQRALLLVATDESEVRRFIQALADAGDRAAAVRFYEKFVQRLQTEYEIEPARVTVECAERVRNAKSPVERRPVAGKSAKMGGAGPRDRGINGGVGDRQLRKRLIAVAAAIVLAATLLVLATRPEPSDSAPGVNPNLVLIGPFRVAAAPEMQVWRNGMVEMLHARFTGDGIPSAVDPSWAIEQWGNAGAGSPDLTPVAAVGLAQQIGAGQLIMGSIVGNPTAFEMSAHIYAVPSGERIADATVAGSEADLVDGLVDSLVLELMGRQVQAEGLGLTSSLTAMRAYFAARDARRRGRLLEALWSYNRALAVDSNFIMAAYGLWRTCRPFGHPSPFECARQQRIRFFSPDDLPIRERQIHAPSNVRLSNRERIRLADEAVQRYPGSAFASYRRAHYWFRLGSYLHPDSMVLPRAAAAIDRALQLDPDNLSYLGLAIEIAAFRVDNGSLHQYWARYRQHSDSTDFLRPYHMWVAAYGLADSAAIREVLDVITRVRIEDWAIIDPVAWRIGYNTLFYGFPHDATNILHERQPTSFGRMVGGLIEGRANEVARIVEDFPLTDPDCSTCDFSDIGLNQVIWSALFAPGFEDAARIVVQRVAPYVQLAPDRFHSAMCWFQMWRLDKEDDIAGSREMLEAASSAGRSSHSDCLVLAAALEARVDPNGPAPKLEALDSVMAEGSVCTWPNLLITDLWTARNEYDRAFAAVRRRRNRQSIACGPYQLPEFLVREGRLSAILGDTVNAIEAYNHYLKLRTDPDSGVLLEERLAVERHLAELSGAGS